MIVVNFLVVKLYYTNKNDIRDKIKITYGAEKIVHDLQHKGYFNFDRYKFINGKEYILNQIEYV